MKKIYSMYEVFEEYNNLNHDQIIKVYITEDDYQEYKMWFKLREIKHKWGFYFSPDHKFKQLVISYLKKQNVNINNLVLELPVY